MYRKMALRTRPLIVYDKNSRHQLFLTSVLWGVVNCFAMLVPTIAVSSLVIAALATHVPFVYSIGRISFVSPLMGFRQSRSLGRILRTLNEAAALALRHSVPCANTQVYFAGDPESGGHPIGRRSIAPETGFRFRCRSWSSAR